MCVWLFIVFLGQFVHFLYGTGKVLVCFACCLWKWRQNEALCGMCPGLSLVCMTEEAIRTYSPDSQGMNQLVVAIFLTLGFSLWSRRKKGPLQTFYCLNSGFRLSLMRAFAKLNRISKSKLKSFAWTRWQQVPFSGLVGAMHPETQGPMVVCWWRPCGQE